MAQKVNYQEYNVAISRPADTGRTGQYWNIKIQYRIYWQFWWSSDGDYKYKLLPEMKYFSRCFVLFLSSLFLQWKQMKLLALKAVQFISSSCISLPGRREILLGGRRSLSAPANYWLCGVTWTCLLPTPSPTFPGNFNVCQAPSARPPPRDEAEMRFW